MFHGSQSDRLHLPTDSGADELTPEPCSAYALGSSSTGTGTAQASRFHPALPALFSRATALRPRVAARDQVGRLSPDCPQGWGAGAALGAHGNRLHDLSGSHPSCRRGPASGLRSSGRGSRRVRCQRPCGFHALRGREGQANAVLVAYDLLEVEGSDTRREPLQKRRERLAKLLRNPKGKAAQIIASGIALSETIDGHKGEAMFRQACRMGLEGIVSKRLGSPYSSGRSRNWQKVKNPDFVRAIRPALYSTEPYSRL
jgi:hypothetical protein